MPEDKTILLTPEQFKEIICQAHMAGQMSAGCKEPSWSEAHSYLMKEEIPKALTLKVTEVEFKTIDRALSWYNDQQSDLDEAQAAVNVGNNINLQATRQGFIV